MRQQEYQRGTEVLVKMGATLEHAVVMHPKYDDHTYYWFQLKSGPVVSLHRDAIVEDEDV